MLVPDDDDDDDMKEKRRSTEFPLLKINIGKVLKPEYQETQQERVCKEGSEGWWGGEIMIHTELKLTNRLQFAQEQTNTRDLHISLVCGPFTSGAFQLHSFLWPRMCLHTH